MSDRLLSKPDCENWISALRSLHPCDTGKLLKIYGVARDIHAALVARTNHQKAKVARNGALWPFGSEKRRPRRWFRPRLEPRMIGAFNDKPARRVLPHQCDRIVGGTIQPGIVLVGLEDYRHPIVDVE